MVFELWVVLTLIGLIIPLLSVFVFHKTVTKLEAFSIVVVNSLVLLFVVFAGSYSSLVDYEILNGYVIEKSRDKVSCSHSYSCNCRTVSCGKGCTNTVCDTCYEHPHDWDYNIKTTIGNVTIDRIDRQGKSTPPRFENAYIGEPASLSNYFTNYIKSAPDSLFNLSYLNNENIKIPDYPSIYDYYRLTRVINDSSELIDDKKINNKLNDALKELGSLKEVNIIVVFTDSEEDSYVDALKAKWLGGKQNDVIIPVILSKSGDIKHVDSFGFSKDSSVYYKINREIKALGNISAKNGLLSKEDEFVDIITLAIRESFVRQDMKDFEYLKDNIDPPFWVVVLGSIFSVFGTGLATFFAHRKDWFGKVNRY